jgi:transposase
VRGAYKWTYLYAALDPSSGESLCMYLPGMDGFCSEAFLEDLGRAYAEYRLLVVLGGAPSHTCGQITLPQNVRLLRLPSYSPESNPVERWFQEFRCALSNRVFDTVEQLQEALTKALEPYWRDPARLRSLAGFSWWVQAIESLIRNPGEGFHPLPFASRKALRLARFGRSGVGKKKYDPG